MTKAPKKIGLKNRLFKNALKTHPFIALRIIIVWIIVSPWFILSLIRSSIKAGRLTKIDKCREFIRTHASDFPNIDPESLSAESLSGGVSNSNHLWHCKTFSGESVTYFTKLFVPIGTFWAKNLSLVSPFPKVSAITSSGRFQADITARNFFCSQGISVPKLIACDSKNKRLVTEYLAGGNLDSLLRKAGEAGILSVEMERMIQECGLTLGKIHQTGYCLVDTQPINCIVTPQGKVFFTDLEFASKAGRKSWDIGFFLCFLAIRLPAEEMQKKAGHLFIEAYRKEAGGIPQAELDKIAKELKAYIPTFRTVLEVRRFKPEELMQEILSPV